VLLTVGGILQSPGVDYTVSGTTITTTSSVTSGIEVLSYIVHKPGTAPTIQDNSVSTATIQDNSISNAKMLDDAIGLAELSATGTPSSSNFLRGDNAWAEAGGGKLLQVVSTTKTDTASTASTSFSDISGLSVAITPAATANKVLVTGVVYGGSSAGGVGAFVLARDSTSLCRGDASSSRTQATGGFETQDNVDVRAVTINFLDSPSTTSEVTYKVQFACPSSNTLTVNKSNIDSNNSSNLRLASTITAMEIGA